MERSAGVLVVKFDNEEPRILGLKIYGSYDLPKGKIEEGESTLEAALREAAEEAGLTDISFDWGREAIRVMNNGRRKKECTLFLGTTTQEPKIKANPETGKFEHHGIRWLTFDEAASMLHAYLRPAVKWARQKMAGQITEARQKSSAKVLASYRTDLDLALSWGRLNNMISSAGSIKKDDTGYSAQVNLVIPKDDFEYQMKDRFGYFIRIV